MPENLIPPQSRSETIEIARSNSVAPWAAPLLIAIFFVVSLALILNFRCAHWDEHFYTQGAVEMVRTGNYLTPTFPDGSYRFNKPILTYWVLYFSYLITGISNTSSQVPFLLIGCGTLSLVYLLAKRLYNDGFTALLALCILLGNFEFFRISSCSITDGLLTFTALICHFGFMQILLRDRRDSLTFACAWLGFGLGVTTKGWVGGTPLLFVIAHGILTCRLRETLSKIIHIPWMLAGAAVGVAWIVAMLTIHGRDFTDKIFIDQFGRRLSNSTWAANLGFYPLIVFSHFLPWLIPAFVAIKTDRVKFLAVCRERRDVLVYAGVVLGGLMVLFIPGNQARLRYMLPAFPVVTVAIAGVLGSLDRDKLLANLRTTARVVGVLGWVVIAAGAAIAGPLDSRIYVGAALAAAMILVGMIGVGIPRFTIPAMALMVLSSVALNDSLLEGALHETPAPRLAATLKLNSPQSDKVYVATHTMMTLGSQILVEGKGRWHVLYEFKKNTFPADADAIILTDREQPKLKLDDFDVQPVMTAYSEFDPFESLVAWSKGKLPEYIEKSRRVWMLAVRKKK